MMGGIGREGHECEAEVYGADSNLELAKGLDEHRRLDVPDSPAHLNEAHVQDPNDDADDVPPSRPMQWRRRPRRRLMTSTAGIRTAEGTPSDLGILSPARPSPNVHPKAWGRLWAWAVRREERECLMATTANWGRWAPVVCLLANDGPTAMTALDKQKPTRVGEWTMQSSR